MKSSNSSILTPNSSLNEAVYREYYSNVYGYIISKINNIHDAEDLTADVFVKIYAKLDTFDESKASLSTWIYTVTKNTLTDYYRTRKVFFEIPEDAEDEISVEDEICNAEALENLANALEALDKRERDIIILHYYSGKTLKEIAEKLGISYAYVKILQNKALENLRKKLQNNCSHFCDLFV